MEKYGTPDVRAAQRAELDGIRSQLELLRGCHFTLSLSKETASEHVERLQARARALEEALVHSGGGGGAQE